MNTKTTTTQTTTTKANHFVSASCRGEICSLCKEPATHKVGEEIPSDEPPLEQTLGSIPYLPMRHNYTAYVCCEHFAQIMRTFVRENFCKLPAQAKGTQNGR